MTDIQKQPEAPGRRVTLKLYATLGRLMPPEGAGGVNIRPGMTVAELVEPLGIPLSDTKLIFVDGRKASLDTKLNGGERVGIFPPVGGG